MSSREFWAAEAAKMRDTSALLEAVGKTSFAALWSNYPSEKAVSHTDPKTGKDPYDHGCAIKLSHCLNKSGIKLNGYSGAKCESDCPLGKKGSHALRATELAYWLKDHTFEGMSEAINITGENFIGKIKNKTGIAYFEDYWQREGESGDARSGDHIDLWDTGTLASNGVFESWLRRTYPTAATHVGLSDLSKSKKILFFEIK